MRVNFTVPPSNIYGTAVVIIFYALRTVQEGVKIFCDRKHCVIHLLAARMYLEMYTNTLAYSETYFRSYIQKENFSVDDEKFVSIPRFEPGTKCILGRSLGIIEEALLV